MGGLVWPWIGEGSGSYAVGGWVEVEGRDFKIQAWRIRLMERSDAENMYHEGRAPVSAPLFALPPTYSDIRTFIQVLITQRLSLPTWIALETFFHPNTISLSHP
ncbi:hypothetical protein SADUNF_Sadunf08G0155300 [Salix dunnii]|uniref:Uncharacterized protein n=1 Tax=Salix dunnii TaxID=1413687 RepID=A0A835JXJ6_9ROSI|nr:hypothetical protein SADUNF_Sadunf08G0155300 [Salix dunnii]